MAINSHSLFWMRARCFSIFFSMHKCSFFLCSKSDFDFWRYMVCQRSVYWSSSDLSMQVRLRRSSSFTIFSILFSMDLSSSTALFASVTPNKNYSILMKEIFSGSWLARLCSRLSSHLYRCLSTYSSANFKAYGPNEILDFSSSSVKAWQSGSTWSATSSYRRSSSLSFSLFRLACSYTYVSRSVSMSIFDLSLIPLKAFCCSIRAIAFFSRSAMNLMCFSNSVS